MCMHRTIGLFVLLVLTPVFFAGAIHAGNGPQARTIVVSAPNRDYAEVPVSITVAADSAFKGVSLRTAGSRASVPCQFMQKGDTVRLTWIVRALKKGSSKSYRLEFMSAAPAEDRSGVRVEQGTKAVDVLIGGRLFTSYRFADGPKPYCYPVIGPTGKMVTRSYPMKDVPDESRDHKHHRSFWFTFGDVNGVDFWSESPKAGRIVHRKFEALESGPIMGRIRSLNDWIAPNGTKVCEDVRELRIYRTSAGRLMDFDVTIHATEGPVTFGDTKEGMMGFRVASSMDVDRDKGHIQNSRGETDRDAWGRPAEWCDYYGPVDGDVVGVAVMEHPSSFRHPTYWHVRTYGLFAANPFGLNAFTKGKVRDGSHTIPAGGELRFRYRIFIHKGSTGKAGVAELFDAYRDPPKVTVKEPF